MFTVRLRLTLGFIVLMGAGLNAQSSEAYTQVLAGQSLCVDRQFDESICKSEYHDAYGDRAGSAYSLSHFDDKLISATAGQYWRLPRMGDTQSTARAQSTETFRLQNIPSRVFLGVAISFVGEVTGDDPYGYTLGIISEATLRSSLGESRGCRQSFTDPSPLCTMIVQVPQGVPWARFSHMILGVAKVFGSGTLNVDGGGRIISVVILDSDRQPLPDAIIMSDSGTEYPADFSYFIGQGQATQGFSSKEVAASDLDFLK